MNAERTRGWALALAAVAACGLPVYAGGGDHAKGHAHAEVGKPAPDFTGTDLAGKKHKLSDLKGKIVVLEWTNHECPYVQRHHAEKKTTQKLAEKFKDKDVVWLAVDSSHFCRNKSESIKAHVKKTGIDYPVLLDPKGEIGHAYQAKTTPHMFVIGKDGILAYQGAIDDDMYGTAARPTNYVADAVQALLDGKKIARTSTKSYGCGVKYKK